MADKRCVLLSSFLLCLFPGAVYGEGESEQGQRISYFSYDAGGGGTLFSVGSRPVRGLLLRRMQEALNSRQPITVYCAGNPGPRFVEIGTEFFTLNGKSMVEGARVKVVGGGIEPVTELYEMKGLPTDGYGNPKLEVVKAAQDLVDLAKDACP